MEIITTLLIGAFIGWLGSMFYRGKGLGLAGNLIVGILGSFVGFWLLGELGISFGAGLIGSILTGVVGAIVVLFLFNLIFKRRG